MADDNAPDDIEIGDVEEYRNEPQNFSHQQLVMLALTKSITAGCQELTEGRIEKKRDKHDNISMVYIPDKRKSFIESVKTAKNIMSCDFDEEAIKNIKILSKRLKEKKAYWINQEHSWFNSLRYEIKQNYIKNGIGIYIGAFNLSFHFHNFYVDDEINIYRKILEQLNKLSKRIGFYSGEMSTG